MKFNDFETNSRILCAKIAKQRERGHSNKSRDTFFAHDAFRRLLMHSDATALKLTVIKFLRLPVNQLWQEWHLTKMGLKFSK